MIGVVLTDTFGISEGIIMRSSMFIQQSDLNSLFPLYKKQINDRFQKDHWKVMSHIKGYKL